MANNVIIVGKGSIGERHARILNQIDPSIEIFFYRSLPSNEKNHIWTIEQAVDLNPRFVAICNPASKHFETFDRFWKLGYSCFIEKPLGCSEIDLINFKNVESRRGQIVQIGYNLQFHPGLVRLKEIIQQGMIGRILYVISNVGQYLPDWRPSQDYREGISGNRAMGGGVILELSHELHYLQFLFGRIVGMSSYKNRVGNFDIDTEDVAMINLEFHSSEKNNIPVHINMDFLRRKPVRDCTIIGDLGTLYFDFLENKISFDKNKNESILLYHENIDKDFTYRKQWESFQDSLKNGQVKKNTLSEGIETLNIAISLLAQTNKLENVEFSQN